MEEQDEQEYIITVKQSEKFQMCSMMAYFAIIKSDEVERDKAMLEFVQDVVKIIITGLKSENHDSDLSLNFVGITVIYDSCLATIYMIDCPAGKDFLKYIIPMDEMEGPEKDIQTHIKEFKRVAHYFVNDIDKRYGHVPEMALLRKQTEATWSWLRKN
ncbi:MAG: hypothetical protein V4615_01125 [Bacteroidota bacterium]